ncbi:MAG: RNA pseudouridine synthase [Clostridia bacterium]|nr:RNA pseudouridine synthase [Clostridia bacterium]
MTFYSIPPWNEFTTQLRYLPAFSVCSAIYEDEGILVVDKHKGAEVTEELLSELNSIHSPLFAVHRLDANTEGVCVFAKNELRHDELSELFYHHKVKKIYHAILVGEDLPNEGRLVNYAKKEGEGMVLCKKEEAGALRMELAYKILQRREGLSKAEIELITGRTHQIRVQFAAINHPILGCDRYGDYAENRKRRCKTQQLLSKRLTIEGRTFESLKELCL